MSLKPGDNKAVLLRLTVPYVGCAYDLSDCNQLPFNINMKNNRKPMCNDTPIAGTLNGFATSKCVSKVDNTDWVEEQFTNFTIKAAETSPVTYRSYVVLANFIAVAKGDHEIWEDYRTPPYEVTITIQMKNDLILKHS